MAEFRRRTSGSPPVAAFELRDLERETQNETDRQPEAEAERALPNGFLDDLAMPGLRSTPKLRFLEILRHLPLRNVVWGLDEFHLARQPGLESPTRQLIGRFGSLRAPRPAEKLFVTGSRQQHVRRVP